MVSSLVQSFINIEGGRIEKKNPELNKRQVFSGAWFNSCSQSKIPNLRVMTTFLCIYAYNSLQSQISLTKKFWIQSNLHHCSTIWKLKECLKISQIMAYLIRVNLLHLARYWPDKYVSLSLSIIRMLPIFF